jgi:quercetin dioxygenase-like cupin family protein
MNPLHHLNKTRTLSLLIASALVAFAGLMPVPARATPTCGVVSTNLLDPIAVGYFPSGLLELMCKECDLNFRLMLKVKGDADLYVTENTFDPDGQTGWHSHPGPSLVTVTEGTLTVYHDDCTFETFTAGETFTDLGCGDIHNVRNETGAEAKDVAVQIVPHDVPKRTDEPDPGCPNVPPCPSR